MRFATMFVTTVLSVALGCSAASAADAGKPLPLKESIEAMLRSNHSLKSIQEKAELSHGENLSPNNFT